MGKSSFFGQVGHSDQPYLLLLFLLLAFALRIYHLDYYDISGDEAWSVSVASWTLSEIVSSDSETNPPLYHLALHLMTRLGGTSVFVIRYGSVLAGILSLAYIGRLGRIVGGRRLSQIVTIVGATSPFLIYYAQDARMYGPALVGSAGSVATFVMLSRTRRGQYRSSSRMLWLEYIATSLIAVYSHYYAFAILLSQAVWVTLDNLKRRRWPNLRPWITAWLLMAALFAPWPLRHMRYLDSKASSRFEEWSIEKLWEIGRRTLIAYGAGITLPASDTWHGWVIATLALLGFVALVYRSDHRRLGLYFAGTLLIAILFAWTVNPIMPFYYERYLLVGMPLFLILLAAGISALIRLWKPLASLGMAIVLFVNTTSLLNQFYELSYDKGGYGRLMAEIEGQARPGDLMLLNNPLQASLFDYYHARSVPFERIDRGKIFSDQSANELLSVLTGSAQRIWLVETGNPESYDPRHRVQRWLGQHGSRAFYQNYGNGNILHLFFLSNTGEQQSHALSATINQQIELTGYAASPEFLHKGDTLLLTLYWQALAPIERGYTVFTHLIDANGQLVAQTDGQPVGGAQPTNSWQLNEVVEDRYALLLPANLPAGKYTLRAGMYLWPELTRLPADSAESPIVDNAIFLGTVEVVSGSP